jgi:hypothetical protein
MLSWPRRQRQESVVAASVERSLIQTETVFTSLTCAVSALLADAGMAADADIIAARSGDSFALQWSPDDWATGLAGCPPGLAEGLGDLGLSAKLAAGTVAGEPDQRLVSVLRGSLSNARPVLVCGGWPPLTIGERDWQWGLVYSHDGHGAYLGNTMRDALAYNQHGMGITWPHYTCQPSAAYLVDAPVPAEDHPGRKVRRALQRGAALLRGEGAAPGRPAGAEALLEWLRGGPDTMAGRKPYPFPKRLAMRCQLESQARYLSGAVRVSPARKRGDLREASRLAAGAATALLRAEPARSFPRAEATRHGDPRNPWTLGAWDRQASDLATSAEAREREIALISDLRDRVARLAEALEHICAD